MNILRVGIAAGSGALIGSLLSLEWLPPGWWPLGTLVGMLIGWILYDSAGFFEACKRACIGIIHALTPSLATQALMWQCLLVSTLLCTLCAWLGELASFSSDARLTHTVSFVSGGAFGVMLSFLWVMGTFVYVGINDNQYRYKSDEEVIQDITYMKEIVLYYNPIMAPFTLSAIFAKHVMPVIWKAMIAVFVFTASDGRIAASVGASIGATAGYFLGSALIGMIVGALVAMGLVYVYKHRDDIASHFNSPL